MVEGYSAAYRARMKGDQFMFKVRAFYSLEPVISYNNG